MQMAVLELVEHRLDLRVVVRKRFADTGWQPRIVDQFVQGLAGEGQVFGAAFGVIADALFP